MSLQRPGKNAGYELNVTGGEALLCDLMSNKRNAVMTSFIEVPTRPCPSLILIHPHTLFGTFHKISPWP